MEGNAPAWLQLCKDERLPRLCISGTTDRISKRAEPNNNTVAPRRWRLWRGIRASSWTRLHAAEGGSECRRVCRGVNAPGLPQPRTGGSNPGHTELRTKGAKPSCATFEVGGGLPGLAHDRRGSKLPG